MEKHSVEKAYKILFQMKAYKTLDKKFSRTL